MGETTLQRAVRYRQRAYREHVGRELRRVREEAGLSMRELGSAVGIDPAHISRVEAGTRDIGQATLVALTVACGADPSFRAFPSDGPRLRDRHQVRMLEAVLAAAHPRWAPRLEVPVHDPVRGVIDLVLRDRLTSDLVAGEGHSALTAVDAQLRWATRKAEALPSADGYPWGPARERPTVSQLLVLRATTTMRDLVRGLPETFATAYPARYEETIEALTTGTTRWPGDALLWVAIEGRRTRVLDHSPIRR